MQILKRAVEAPTRQIAENSSVDAGVVVARMLGGKGNEGFDAERKEYVDLIEAGIIDPTKVVRVALENAVSVASVLLLTEATMTESARRRSKGWRQDLGMSLQRAHVECRFSARSRLRNEVIDTAWSIRSRSYSAAGALSETGQ